MLVVEDEAIIAQDLSEILAEAGFDVVATVADEAAARRCVQAHEVDIALVDVRIPSEVAGIDLAGIRLAEELWTCDRVPVVFVTAFPGMIGEATAMNTGAFGVVSKPYSAESLLAQVRVALARGDEIKVATSSPG